MAVSRTTLKGTVISFAAGVVFGAVLLYALGPGTDGDAASGQASMLPQGGRGTHALPLNDEAVAIQPPSEIVAAQSDEHVSE